MKATLIHGLLPALVVAGLNACGGGGGALLAGGGISGTGTGTITGFGSVIINDIREFQIDADTQILCDGEVISEQELIIRGPGSVVTFTVRDDVNADITAGTAASIDIGNLVKGPVTSLDPLRVLGQDIVITADTAYYENDLPVAAPFNPGLAVDDEVEINGFADVNGTLVVSRIERTTLGLAEWKLTGAAAAPASGGDFNIGGQEVELGSVVPRDCSGNVVAPGDFVEVKAAPVAPFNAGDILTASDVECLMPGLPIPANATGTVLEAEVEGLVTSISLPQIVINGQAVNITGAVFEGLATANDIEIGMKLEAEGDLNTTTGILAADRIRLRDRRVRIEAPAGLPLGASFAILQAITVNTSALTEDNDDLINNGSGDRQVEVRGYLDANDEVIATEVRDSGNADASKVRLRGPVGDECNPAVGGDEEFDILSVIVDTDPTVALTEFSDQDGTVLSQQGFCDLATTGTFVQVENGQFNSLPAARIDNAERIEIED